MPRVISLGTSFLRDAFKTDWQESFIVNLYMGKKDALNRGYYRYLELIQQVMKVLERVVEGGIRQGVEIDEMRCGFSLLLKGLIFNILVSGRGTSDATSEALRLTSRSIRPSST